MTARELRVLVVDDSAVVREAMISVLSREPGFVVSTAADPVIARRKIAIARPDVIVLDLEMPREDGLSFLRALMPSDPIPVVICSTHSVAGSRAALEALRYGAVDVVAKPLFGIREFVEESAILLTDAIRGAARARMRGLAQMPLPPVAQSPRAGSLTRSRAAFAGRPSTRLVAIAASTGGPQSLHQVLRELPADTPGVVVVQHMPAGFTGALARHLDRECRVVVKEAEDRDVVLDGRVLIAPGDRHMALEMRDGQIAVGVSRGPLVSRHRPSADVLFTSVAGTLGSRAMGVIMTGMGDDGAAGLLTMRETGGWTVAQDESSCVVFGMPRAAIQLGAVAKVTTLTGIAGAITAWTHGHGRHDTTATV